ncbi:uncharacterized protein LOC114032987 [Vombatus ursinus]|uniref:uncharacterized protein LOC114032987 n=1 Tax=Vombatus ursinus TaxID=29139 RepID=UPI000FFD2C39|nr:uncharacterized protein LOC114032987 [Vombatus ursinus]
MDKLMLLLGLLGSLQVTSGAHIPLLRTTNSTPPYVYWTVIPGFPHAAPATWVGDPVPLRLAGSGSLVLGGHSSLGPVVARVLNKTVTWESKHLPICLTKAVSDPWCAQVQNMTIRETPHGPHSNLGQGDFLHMWAIAAKNRSAAFQRLLQAAGSNCSGSNKSRPDVPCNRKDWLNATGSLFENSDPPSSPLPPCHPTPNMFDVMQVCSTGHLVWGPEFNTTSKTEVYFMDGFPGPYFPAPVPHVLHNATLQTQLHLWKAAAAFGEVIHMTDNSAPLADNATINRAWFDRLFKEGYTCTEHLHKGHCNNFTIHTQTVRNMDMFLLCENATITNTSLGLNVTCPNGRKLTNTLMSINITNETRVFVLTTPPLTFLPVGTDKPFADSDFFRAVLNRGKRGFEVTAVDFIGLVASLIEQVEISTLYKRVGLVEDNLRDFMQLTTKAWIAQQDINKLVTIELSALTSAVQALATLIQVNSVLEGLPCHHVLPRPMCMTAAVHNASRELDEAIRTLNEHSNMSDYLRRLEDIVLQIKNETDQYKQQIQKDHGILPEWFNQLELSNWLNYVLSMGSMVFFLLVMCICLPCLLSYVVRLWRMVLEQVKADIFLRKQKGGVVRGGRP